MRRIAVIGAGYVGLVTAACLAELGNTVSCVEIDPGKIELLSDGGLPLFEPGLLELVAHNRKSGRLTFVNNVAAGIAGCEIVFIAVGTPTTNGGELDLSAVRRAAADIAAALDGPKIIVNKSTVPLQTGDLVASIIRERKTSQHRVTVVSNPEFLREGSAIADFMQPDRIVIGVSDAPAEATLRSLYAPLAAPFVVTDRRTAEMIKLTANAFLAVKISFINEIANICERAGADVKDVVSGAGSDRRIGASYMNPGLGFGGSCIPKDVRALQQIAEKLDVQCRILGAALAVNAAQIQLIVSRLKSALNGISGKHISILGLAFKPNTDDVRESPPIALVRELVSAGALVAAHDPAANENARVVLGSAVTYSDSSYEAARGADALVVATDWNEYKHIDFTKLRKLMSGRVIFDVRNIYDPKTIAGEGFRYVGVGRSAPEQVESAAADLRAESSLP